MKTQRVDAEAQSLDQCSPPASQKRAMLFLFLMRQGLDPHYISNYSLSFFSKLLERCVSFQLVDCLDANYLMPLSNLDLGSFIVLSL